MLYQTPDPSKPVLPPDSQMVPDFLRQPHGVVIVFEEVWVSLAILQKSDVGESLGGGLVQVLGFGLQT